MIDIVLIIFIIATLAWETQKVIRKKGRPVTGLLSVVILAFIALAMASGLDWNGGLPLPLWWGITVWTAALIGIYTARVVAGPIQSAGGSTTPPTPQGRPQAAAQTAPR